MIYKIGIISKRYVIILEFRGGLLSSVSFFAVLFYLFVCFLARHFIALVSARFAS